MDENEEKSLDIMVESLLGQIDMNGPQMQVVAKTGDAKALIPLVFTMGHTIEALYREIGRLDARVKALESGNR
ncbi:hypothetical protein MANY_53710 [Mycolicibacterium anyangense]|uniref:Uncharacterized protein n=1 Tax=Mycolicibacterium anyangense TaxID=1431246 RepID=A0A6N4WIZ9_9MYCO|nr:hypothetical protein [Mycolicibacterium anyangense]BBZ80034.1 hypothetical protein MANY_53710 [Mycolicibacterium anyangense]